VRTKNAVDSFRHALDGILHGFRAQRHMRFHFVVAVLALLAGVIYGLTRAELLVLLFSIALVLIAEMFNTAVEAVVDLVTQTYHPLAKHAKDVAAGAVLVAALNAIVVGLILFFDVGRIEQLLTRQQHQEPGVLQMIVITLVLLLVLLVIWKVLGGRGTFLRGGVVSGHTAIGFCVCTIILLLSRNPFVAFLAILMALIIAQSRVEAGVHTLQEVLMGALLGIVLPVILFQVIPSMMRHLATTTLNG
jgi:diacylglycerol kinase (ATP)